MKAGKIHNIHFRNITGRAVYQRVACYLHRDAEAKLKRAVELDPDLEQRLISVNGKPRAGIHSRSTCAGQGLGNNSNVLPVIR